MRNRERVKNYIKGKKEVREDGTLNLTPAQGKRVKKKGGNWQRRNKDEENE